MIYIVLGGLGFLTTHVFDIISLKRIPRLKPLTWLAGNGLLIYAAIMLCLSPDKLSLPSWSTWLGWVMLPICLSMLVYSLFVNLPFGKTYIATGVGDKLITSGFYTLVRHPGVHWLTLTVLALVLVSSSRLMLIAAPIWVSLDIVLVAIQDRFLFGKMFTGYAKYRRQTPMLIPNRRSINTFLNSLKHTRA